MNLGATIAGHAALAPAKAALFTLEHGELTYRRLVDLMGAIAATLDAAGLGRASRVGVLLEHGLAAAVVYPAVSSACIAVPLEPMLTEHELTSAWRMFDLDALVVGQAHAAIGGRLAKGFGKPLLMAEIAAGPDVAD